MNVIIAGSTGMVGKLIMESCVPSEKIEAVTTLVRKPSQTGDKIKEVVVKDFGDYSDQENLFQGMDIGFFCIGAYTGQVSDDLFKKITVDYAVAFAKELKRHNPNATLCMLSGAGADRSEKSRTAFARYKGMAENQISALGLQFYTFRPAYIYPVTPRKEPNFIYSLSRSLYPLIRLMGENASIKSTELAEAMVTVGLHGAEKEILENKDILSVIEYA